MTSNPSFEMPEIVKISKSSPNLYIASLIDLAAQNFSWIYPDQYSPQKHSIQTAQDIISNRKHGTLCFGIKRDVHNVIKPETFEPFGYAVYRLNTVPGSNQTPKIDACIEQCFAGGRFPNVINALLIRNFVYTLQAFCDQVGILPYPDVFMELPLQLESEVSRYQLLGFNPVGRQKDLILMRGDFQALSLGYDGDPGKLH